MRLAEFIVANIEPILAEWEAFAPSTAEEGTTFTVRIPRFLPVESDNPDEAIAAG